MKKDLIVPVLGIPVMLFLMSRMSSVFVGVVQPNILFAVQAVAVLAGFALLFIFRNKIYQYLEDTAYGFGATAITIYVLSVLVCFKYRGVATDACTRQSIDCIIGAGLLLGLFVLFFAKGADGVLKKIKKPTKRGWIFFIATAVLLNIQAIAYCKFMKEIFVWDNAGYFITVHKLNDLFPSMEYFKAVYQSVFETDYNYIIALPASIFCKLFGESRLVFVLSIVNFYLLPLVTVIYALASRIFKNSWSVIFVVFALPYMIFATNTGFIDIGGAVFALVAAIIFLWGDGKEMSVLSGVLLALCVLMRRWYSFYALSFIIAAVVWSINKKQLKSFLYLVLSFAFVLLFFAQDFVTGKLMADYRYMYSAYALGLLTDIKLTTRYFGVCLPLVLAVYTVYKQIKTGTKMTPAFFMLIQGAVCFALFTSLQTHGQQHLALYVPMFAILILYAIGMPQKTKCNQVLSAVVSVICVINMASVFVLREQPTSIREIKGASAVPTFSIYPPRDENAESFLAITEYMDAEIGAKGKTVCFLASSVEMNYDTLRNAEVSLSVKKKIDIDRESYYYFISDVDKRDGLSDSLFATDYILVPSKLQIHLAPEEQRVISVPYEHIISGTGIGEAYEKQEKSFTLSSGDEIFVYKKLRDITPEEIQNINNEIFN